MEKIGLSIDICKKHGKSDWYCFYAGFVCNANKTLPTVKQEGRGG
jgi:hypothetical protein